MTVTKKKKKGGGGVQSKQNPQTHHFIICQNESKVSKHTEVALKCDGLEVYNSIWVVSSSQTEKNLHWDLK